MRGSRAAHPADPTIQRGLEVDAGSALPSVTAKLSGWPAVIFRKRIERADPAARPGDLVVVQGVEGETLGHGLYNPRSEMAVRTLATGSAPPDAPFWEARLRRAVELRRETLRLDEVANVYRVLHAEGDGFPGLVVDRFGDLLSAEAFSLAMYQRTEAILVRLHALLGTRHHRIRTSPAFLSQEGFAPPELASPDAPEEVVVLEHGTRFRVRFAESHKTGFFCDQRDNRLRLAGLCREKSVLDLCCYTGGFAVQAKRLGGAAEVIGVDLDEAPLKLARENANLNQVRVRFVQADAFAWMRDIRDSGRRFQVVVLDPPKLIRTREEIEDGKRKHFDLSKLAMQLVEPGGWLLSCSCAGLLGEEEFLRMLYTASRQVGPLIKPADDVSPARHAPREMQVLYKTGAAPDHPVSAQYPEGEYLKAVWMRLL